MSIEFISPFIIKDNPYQGRLIFDRARMAELAEDILSHREALPDTMGMIQIPVGRRLPNGEIELSVGHRRREAFKLLFERYGDDWGQMPIDLQDLSDEQVAKTAWSENEEREDLTAIEKAMSIERIQQQFGLGLKEVAKFLGANLPTLSNLMRLRQLPERVQKMVLLRELAEKTARSLLNLIQVAKNEPATLELALKARDEDMSATAVEKEVEQLMSRLTRVIDDRIGSTVFAEAPQGCTPTCEECPLRSKYRGKFVCARPEQYQQKQQQWYASQIPVLSSVEVAEFHRQPIPAPGSAARPTGSERDRLRDEAEAPPTTAPVAPVEPSLHCPSPGCGSDRIVALNRAEDGSSQYLCLTCGKTWPSIKALMDEINGVSPATADLQALIDQKLAGIPAERAAKIREMMSQQPECLAHLPELLSAESPDAQIFNTVDVTELRCALTISNILRGPSPL